jgi:uncharacterized RDD family membrane protein YckC
MDINGYEFSNLSRQPAPIEPGQPEERVVTVIGFGRRLVAYLIDAAILWVIAFCLSFGIMGLAASGGGQEAASGDSVALQCVSMLVAVAYFVIFWATSGQTPGKMAMGIKVIGADGTPVTWGQAILRYIGYIISGIVAALGFIWIAFDSKRQGWHDKIAKTYVVHKETQFSAGESITLVPSDAGSSTAVIIAVLAFILLVLLPIFVIAILLLLGPVIGSVFSNIVENLTTPVP